MPVSQSGTSFIGWGEGGGTPPSCFVQRGGDPPCPTGRIRPALSTMRRAEFPHSRRRSRHNSETTWRKTRLLRNSGLGGEGRAPPLPFFSKGTPSPQGPVRPAILTNGQRGPVSGFTPHYYGEVADHPLNTTIRSSSGSRGGGGGTPPHGFPGRGDPLPP